MHRDLAQVHRVPHHGKTLVYAPLQGFAALVNGTAATEIERLQRGELEAATSPLVAALVSRLADRPTTPPRPRTGPFAPRQLGVLPTNDCHLECQYCAPAVPAPFRAVMSAAVCVAAVDLYAGVAAREGFRSLVAYYFGGEPLLAFERVRLAQRTLRSHADRLGIPAWAACATSGVLPAAHARWAARHLAFAQVSMDGPAEIHDRTRPGAEGRATHARVVRTLRIFQEHSLPFALRCTVDTAAVERLPETAEYLCREFQPAFLDVEPVLEVGRCRERGLSAPDSNRFVRAFVAAGARARQHGVDMALSSARPGRPTMSLCGVSDDNLVVAPDGTLSPCYTINHGASPHASGLAFGHIDESGRVHLDDRAVARARALATHLPPRCLTCFCRWHCAAGCRLFQSPAECTDAPDWRCLVTRHLTVWKLLEQLHLPDEADRVAIDEEEARRACA